MNKIFSEMFSRQPDEIIGGDYFYRVPWYEQEWSLSILARQYGMSEAEYLERMEKKSRKNFRSGWDERTFHSEWKWLECLRGDDKATEIFQKIARERIPFMDIASSEVMGLASYILKLNPQTPCLVTDIDSNAMKRLRSRADESLPEYHISIASFDNLDMPLKDHSVDCITSVGGISDSATGKPVNSAVMSIEHFTYINKIKLLNEVYRVLKPNGRFITVELEMDAAIDWQKIDSYFSGHEKLFGMYTQNVVQTKLKAFEEWQKKYAVRDEKMTAAGFEIEIERRHCAKMGADVIAQYLSPTGDSVQLEKHDPAEDIIGLYMCSVLYILRKPL